MMNRRTLLLGVGAALAAPAIVRADSLMKVAQLRSSVGGNTIEDYEEGVWTPIVNGVRHEGAGRYKKIGHAVYFSAPVPVMFQEGGVFITGLPFHRAA